MRASQVLPSRSEVGVSSSVSSAVSKEAEIIAQAKVVQTQLVRDLHRVYAKAFDPKFKPGWNFQRFNEVKKPLAKALDVLSNADFTSLNEVAYFISYFERAVRLNIQSDPAKWYDFLRGKSEGGVLGNLLKNHVGQIQKLKSDLAKQAKQKKYSLDSYLSLLRHNLAMAEEMKFACNISEDFSLTNTNKKHELKPLVPQLYHTKELRKIYESDLGVSLGGTELSMDRFDEKDRKAEKKRLAKNPLREEMLEVVSVCKSELSSGEECEERIAFLQNKIQEAILQKLEVGSLETALAEGNFIIQTNSARMKKAIAEHLVQEFNKNLVLQEKLYLWKFCAKRWNAYGQEPDDIIEAPFYNDPAPLDKLKNRLLSSAILNAISGIDFNKKDAIKELINEINKAIKYHFKEYLQNLYENKYIVGVDGHNDNNLYGWKPMLMSFLNDALIKPLENLDRMVLLSNLVSNLANVKKTENGSPFSLFPPELAAQITSRLSHSDFHRLLAVSKQTAQETLELRDFFGNVVKTKTSTLPPEGKGKEKESAEDEEAKIEVKAVPACGLMQTVSDCQKGKAMSSLSGLYARFTQFTAPLVKLHEQVKQAEQPIAKSAPARK